MTVGLQNLISSSEKLPPIVTDGANFDLSLSKKFRNVGRHCVWVHERLRMGLDRCSASMFDDLSERRIEGRLS